MTSRYHRQRLTEARFSVGKMFWKEQSDYSQGRSNPLVVDSDNLEELYGVCTFLENGFDEPCEFLQVTTLDGEYILVNIAELQILESPTHMIKEGQKFLR